MQVNSIRFEDTDDEKSEEKRENPALLDRMIKTRAVLITGEINKELAERVVRQLFILEQESDEPIRVFIDSPGGDADAGYAIFDTIRFVKPEVTMIGMGLVASAGALILLAGSREKRFAFPNSHYLIHQPASGMRGVATEIEIHAREIEKMRERINRLIAEETGQEFEKVAADTDRDYWMGAQEALEYGLVSRIVTSRGELEN